MNTPMLIFAALLAGLGAAVVGTVINVLFIRHHTKTPPLASQTERRASVKSDRREPAHA